MTSETRPTPRERTISLRFGKNAIDQFLLKRLEGSGHNMSTELKRLAYERLLGLGTHAPVHHVQEHQEPSHHVTETNSGASSAKPFQKKTVPVVQGEGSGRPGAGGGRQDLFQAANRQQESNGASDPAEHIKTNDPVEGVSSDVVEVVDEHEDDGYDKELLVM